MSAARVRRGIALALLAGAIAGFLGLGIWQLERRSWKLALIAHTEQQLRSAPTPAPGPAAWAGIDRDDVYRPVIATGRYLPGRDTLVQAVTELGGGFWVMTPLQATGFTVLVNRGFVPADARGRIGPPPPGEVRVRGLLRVSEPEGGFLRSNDPAAGRWYSRDVAAIARAGRLSGVAPYFVDAAASRTSGWPRGGLTVVRFRNSHLSYALTWFAMAALFAWLGWRVTRRHASD